MSSSEDKSAELLELIEAELDSLKEELMVALGTRHRFVRLRVAYLEKQIPELKEKAGKAKIHAAWLANINNPKRP